MAYSSSSAIFHPVMTSGPALGVTLGGWGGWMREDGGMEEHKPVQRINTSWYGRPCTVHRELTEGRVQFAMG